MGARFPHSAERELLWNGRVNRRELLLRKRSIRTSHIEPRGCPEILLREVCPVCWERALCEDRQYYFCEGNPQELPPACQAKRICGPGAS